MDKVHRKHLQSFFVCYDLTKQKRLSPGQIYSVLSRVASKDGFNFFDNLRESKKPLATGRSKDVILRRKTVSRIEYNLEAHLVLIL